MGFLMIFMRDHYTLCILVGISSGFFVLDVMNIGRCLQWFLYYSRSIRIQTCCNMCKNMMYIICINLGLELYAPMALVDTNQIHHSYMVTDITYISVSGHKGITVGI